MAYSEGLDLLKPSLDRFLDQANYKNSWMMILEEDKFGLTKNAEAVGIRTVRGNKLHTARAVFKIDRLANNVPYNFVPPRRQYVNRGLYIRKIRGDEIIQYFGVHDRLYLQLDAKPAKTSDLAEALSTQLEMTVLESDIVPEDIMAHKATAIVRFSTKSQSFIGEMLVDITTKAFEEAERLDQDPSGVN